MTSIGQCKICGADSKAFRRLFIGRDRFYEIDGDFAVERCDSCGVVFLNPQPSTEEIRKYYPYDYYSYQDVTYEEPVSSLLTRMKNVFYKRGFRIGRGTRILDVGCGAGEKVSRFLAEGAECYGIDINEQAIAHARARGVNAFVGELRDQKFANGFFDIILLDQVFEHLTDPRQTLDCLLDLLRSDGKVILSIPNYDSATRFLFRRFWIGYDVPRHMFVYSPRSIRQLAGATGFRVDKIRHCQYGYQFLASSRTALRAASGYFKVPSKPSHAFDNRVVRNFTALLLFPLSIVRLGDTIKVFLVKAREQ